MLVRKILALALVLVVFCGCQPKKSDRSNSSTKEPPMDMSLCFWNGQDFLQGDAVQRYIEDKFNVRFSAVSVNYDNYFQILQQLAASDNLPDVIVNDIIGTYAYEAWISQQKIRSIPKNLDKYPNLEAYLDQPYNERFKRDDGYYYMIPRITYSNEDLWALDRCIMVRKDWMENLGLQPPESWEEFEAMLSAFVENDPDGNGLDDTNGLLASHLNTFEAIYLSIFPELSNTERGWMYEDEKWIPVYASKKVGPALAKVQNLYKDGLICEKFPYLSTEEALDAFMKGEYGAICAQYYGVADYMKNAGVENSQDIVQILPPWPAPDGNRYRFTTSLHWSESYFGANATDEKMERILELYDWLLSDEYTTISQYGVEGIDWENKDGALRLIRTDDVPLIVKYPSTSVFSSLVKWSQDEQYELNPANIQRYGRPVVEDAQKALAWYKKETRRLNYNFDIIFLSTPSKNSLIYNREVQDEMVKVIVGKEDAVIAWERAIERFKRTTTLNKAIEDVTAQAKILGINP